MSTLLAATATSVRRGELDCRTGHALAMYASVAIRAIQQGDLEQRLAAVEQRLSGKPKED